MPPTLDHVTLRVADLDRSLTFYERVIGLAPGPRMPFPASEQWLLAGCRPVIRLIGAGAPAPGAAIAQVALAVSGRARLEERLARAGMDWRLQAMPDGSALRMLMDDPDGAALELIFRSRSDR